MNTCLRSQVPSSGGVANLLTFVELFEGADKKKFYEDAYTSSGIRYGDLKNDLAIAMHKELEPIQIKRQELETKPDYIDQVIQDGAQRASMQAQATVALVKDKMGLS